MRSFRRILCTTLAFLVLLLAGSVGLMELYFRLEPDDYQDGSERAALEGSLDLLILGASHAYRGLDPAVIDGVLGTNGYNLSNAMMTMRGRYELLRLELDRNPVRTVILELSFNTMTRSRAEEGPEGDLYLIGRMNRFTDRVSWFFRGFSVQEYPQVYAKLVAEGADALKQALLGRLHEDAPERSRGFLPLPAEAPPAVDPAARHTVAVDGRFEQENIDYFDKILALCREHGVELILITTPLSDSFLSASDGLEFVRNWYSLRAEWNGLHYYDFNLLRDKAALFPEDSAFNGTLHLSGSGAETLSRLLAELIEQQRAGEDLSPLFYADYGEMEAERGFS